MRRGYESVIRSRLAWDPLSLVLLVMVLIAMAVR